MRFISLVLSLVIVFSLGGCSGKPSDMSVTVQERAAKSGEEPFMIRDKKLENDCKLYIENFQTALNRRNVDALREFISFTDDTSKTYVEYLKDTTMRDLIEFYLSNLELEFLEVFNIDGEPYIAVEAKYFDNRYNDFNSLELVKGENPRKEFYDTVNSMVDKQNALVETAGQEPDKVEGTAVQEDISIPTSTSHIGVDYNNTQELEQWVKTLENDKDHLRKFSRIMFFKIVDGTEYTCIAADTADLVALFGSIPAFFGLNSHYSIENYDMFYNFTKFWETLPESEQQAFDTWKTIRDMDDEQVKEMVQEDAVNGVVFNKFDIDKDVDKIRQNLLPAELSPILDTYYNGAGRAYYTYMYENEPYRRLEQNIIKNTDIELIRQKDKTFIVLVTLPDINRLVFGINEGLDAEEMVQKINEQIESGSFETTSVYSQIVMQKNSKMKWGFQLVQNPVKEFLLDSVHSGVLDATGISDWLGSALDENGYLASGEIVEEAGSGLFSGMSS